MQHESRRIGIVVYDGVLSIDVAGPLEVFDTARQQTDGGPNPSYSVEIVAKRAGPIATAAGMEIIARVGFGDCEPFDTVLVAGGHSSLEAAYDDEITTYLRSISGRTRRIASVCTGAFVLAGAGLLDGRRAATHWAYADTLAEMFPNVLVDADPIYLRDGNVYTSAGGTAGTDLALAMVEEDHGRELALHVARCLVMFLKRPGGQSQFSPFLAEQLADHPPIRRLQDWIVENLREDLTVPSLAKRVAMSPRNFTRHFTEEVGASPARYVESLRIVAARHLLEDSRRPVKSVAATCGFGSEEAMRRAFLKTLGVGPAAYRERFRSALD